MKDRHIYIKSAAQISAQEPLCDDWMKNPIPLEGRIATAREADYSQFISPMEGRRMGKIMKRALATSLTCLKEAGVEHPDALISGTGLGSIEQTEAFLKTLCTMGEEYLKPTHFMQSTHNTISSTIGIKTGSHGYNSTYSQCANSFECCLDDACTQFGLGRISNALVGAYDGITPVYLRIFETSGVIGKEMDGSASEVSVSFFLDLEKEGAICELAGTRILYRPSKEKLQRSISSLLEDAGIKMEDLNLVLAGYNGYEANDRIYRELLPQLFPGIPGGRYKHISGENVSASALGFYAATACFKHRFIPATMIDGAGADLSNPGNILIFNHYNNKEFSMTLLCGIY